MASKGTLKLFFKNKGLLIALCFSIVLSSVFLLYKHYTRASSHSDLISIIEKTLLDRRIRNRGMEAPKAKIGILAIDNKSIDVFGRWPFSRRYYKKAFDNLKALGVNWLAFDAVFSESEQASVADAKALLEPILLHANSQFQPDLKLSMQKLNQLLSVSPSDQILADGIKTFHNVVLGYFYFQSQDEVRATMREKIAFEGLQEMDSSAIKNLIFPEGKGPNDYPFLEAHGVIANIAPITAASPFQGFFSNEADEDAITRWVTLVRIMHGQVMPSLSLKLAAEMMDRDILVEFGERGIEALELISRKDETNIVRVPIDSLGIGRALLNPRGPAKTFRHVSLADAYNQTLDEETKAWLKGASLLLGMTAIGVNDIKPNPFDATIDGVELQANAVDNIVSQDFLIRPESIYFFEMLVVLLVGLFFSPLVIFLRPIYSGIVTLLFLTGYYYFDKFFWLAKHEWVYMGISFIEISLLFLTTTILRYVTEEYEKRKIKGAFGHYLAPEVIERLMDEPDGLKLGGERKELTVFFSDVRGFTTISESLNPEQLCEFMNEYFTPMTAIILKSGGVLDKYIGDAIMAFWGAPIALSDQADRTVDAAIEMLSALKKVQHDFKAKGFPFVDIGMGINTGEMSVGNMGSTERFCYTVMGDAVNLGSRLESLTKEYGIHLIVSEFTVARLLRKDRICRDLDDIRVKGKSEPIKVFNILRPGEIAEAHIKDFIGRFEEGRVYYRKQEWAKAAKCFLDCLLIEAKDGPSLLYLKRIEEYKRLPPAPNWDGVYTFAHK